MAFRVTSGRQSIRSTTASAVCAAIALFAIAACDSGSAGGSGLEVRDAGGVDTRERSDAATAARRFRAVRDGFELETGDPAVRFVLDGALYLARGDERILVLEPSRF